MANFKDFQQGDSAIIVREDSTFKRSEEVEVLDVRNGKLKVTNGTTDDWIDPRQVERVQKREQVAPDYPMIDDAFVRHQQIMKEIFSRKMVDYGLDNISMGTSLQSEEERKVAMTAIWTRMWDKMNRLKNLVVNNNEAMVDEKVEDTYIDLANYAIISLIVKDGDWK